MARGEMKTFRDSTAHAFQRLVRSAISKSTLTRSQQAVTLALVNQWFHHKAKGEMHPGREKLADKARCSVRTVAATLSMLRAAGVIKATSYESGGRRATRYRLRFTPLLILCGADLPDWMEGELRPIQMQNCTVSEGKNCTVSGAKIARLPRAKIAHGSKDVSSPEKSLSDSDRDNGEDNDA